MSYVVGVDGGGTHARAVVLDAAGRELARAEAAGAVATADAPEVAAAAVVRVVHEAADRAEVELPGAAIWAGLSGAGHEPARLAVASLLELAGLASRVRVGTDVEAAFHAAVKEGHGILLIAGTGSIAWARTPDGRVGRVGGWGRHLGDEGSGYAIGLGALRAVVRAEDGREPATLLRDQVLRDLDVAKVTDLIAWVASAAKADVAALVGTVTRAAAQGDPAAAGLLGRAVHDLVEQVAAIADRMGPWPAPPPLFLSGGLVVVDGPLREPLLREIAPLAVDFRDHEVDAALGAAELALASLR